MKPPTRLPFLKDPVGAHLEKKPPMVGFLDPGDLLHDVWSLMKERKLVHVPIVDDDLKPLGVLNARDALLVLLEGSEYEEGLLRDYVMGIGYR